MPDPHDPDPTTIGAPVEFTVDLGAFLPETSTIGPIEDAEPHGEDDDAERTAGDAVEDASTPDHVPAPAQSRQPVDVAVLAGIEADLAAVDQALEAIDAGEPGRSPLLTELLADPPPA